MWQQPPRPTATATDTAADTAEDAMATDALSSISRTSSSNNSSHSGQAAVVAAADDDEDMHPGETQLIGTLRGNMRKRQLEVDAVMADAETIQKFQ